MRSNPTRRAEAPRSHAALPGFGDDCLRTLTGLLVYVGALALIGSAVVAAAPALTDLAITAATDAFAGRINLANDAGTDAVRASGSARSDSSGGAPLGTRPVGLRGAI
ncbi:hypothetical protein [Rhodopseudomonas palustris]|uniref:hypothetical protein n=1 Tax=Rhodopseudomonas palustris TaxID=1076 RepID=UPI0011C41C56|nr:hypothetical protein [Rhodopseudomonas palustris]